MAKQLSFFDRKPFAKPLIMSFAKHNAPQFTEVKGHKFISFGDKNAYPNYLIDLYNKSAKHNAIINTKVNYTTGNGWEWTEGSEIDMKLKMFLDSVNSDRESFEDLVKKINLDLEIFGGFYLEVIGKSNGKGVASLRHIDFSYIRSNADNTEFYYTKTWQDSRGNMLRNPEDNPDWEVYKAFDAENTKGATILAYKSYRPSMDVYATPEYTGAIEYIEIDTLISSHHYNNIKNGFVGNVILNFLNGTPTEEEQEEIEEKVKQKFTGSEGQRVMINFADGADSAMTVEWLTQPDVYKSMTDLNKSVEQEILTGHRVVSGMLMGIKTEGQLGGRSEIIEAFELFKNTYIKPKQKILEGVFNYLFALNSASSIKFVTAAPIGMQFSESTLLQISGRDEMREMMGLPLEDKPESSQSQKTLEALNSLSPLLATKVIDTLTTNQVRGLIGLPPVIGGDVVPPPSGNSNTQFSTQKVSVDVFKKYGEKKENFEVVKRRVLPYTFNVDELETRFKATFEQYTELEKSILDLIKKDDKITPELIAKALKVDKKRVEAAIKGLTDSGDLKRSSAVSGDEKIPTYKVTETGVRVIEEQSPRTEDIYIKYSYEVIPSLGAPIIPTTRDFCRDLIQEDKYYSREDIEAISSEIGYNVFEMRGGWYTQKNGVPVPHCRHRWQQVIVKNKK